MLNERARLREVVVAFRQSQLLRAGVELDLFEALDGGPLSLEVLAVQVQAQPDRLLRLAGALASLGLLHLNNGVLSLAPSGRLLTAGHELSLRSSVLMLTGSHYSAWSRLTSVVRGDVQPGDVHAYFHDLASQREEETFRSGSAEGTRALAPVLLAAMGPLSGLAVDAGGGEGTLAGLLLQKHRNLTVIVVDRNSRPPKLAEPLRSRFRFESRDFLDSLPRADYFIFKHVLHNLGDRDVVRALAACKTAAGEQTDVRVFLVERLLPDTPGSGELRAFLGDLHMMLTMQGRLRTQSEYGVLLSEAGLELVGAVHLQDGVHLLTGRSPSGPA